jgi:hypothetical protein
VGFFALQRQARRGECFVKERPSGVRLMDGTMTRWFEVRERGWFFTSFVDAFLDERTAIGVAEAINAGRRSTSTYNGAAVRTDDPRIMKPERP